MTLSPVATDVLIIGGGGSGLSAAISAAEAGASVVLIEKRAELGGSTSLSVGSFSAAGTVYQGRAHVEDSVEDFDRDMRTANGVLDDLEDPALRRLLAENAGPTLAWMGSIGVQFFGPTPEPPFTQPRMHNVIPSSRAYAIALEAEARKKNVTIVRGSRVRELITDSAGTVVGAIADQEYHAKAVILATGDYSASAELKERFGSKAAAAVPAINPESTGDGFTLGMSVGADVRNMSRLGEQLRLYPASRGEVARALPASRLSALAMKWGAHVFPFIPRMLARRALTSWVSPVGRLYEAGAILVGRSGGRVADEEDIEAVARTLANSTENSSYVIFDERIAQQFSAWPNFLSTFPGVAYAYVDDYRRFRPDAFFEASTVGELAELIGVPSDALKATVEQWNAAVAAGSDATFGRSHLGSGLSGDHYYAIGPIGAVIPITDGGLRIDTQCRVVREDGSVIDGLWAVGSTGQGGLILMNHGLHIAWAMTSGRIAGSAAALSALRQQGARKGVHE